MYKKSISLFNNDLLKEKGCTHIKLFGGGGGVILPTEIEELHKYGITRIYSPDDGRSMGLQGMINDLLKQCDYPTGKNLNGEVGHADQECRDPRRIGDDVPGRFGEETRAMDGER